MVSLLDDDIQIEETYDPNFTDREFEELMEISTDLPALRQPMRRKADPRLTDDIPY